VGGDGADGRRIGRFEQANHGTLFLNEIGDLSLPTQARILRVLQEKAVRRIGGKEDIPVDVRVIAATDRPLERAIQKKQFREDLYYRLSVYVIRLPELRDRREDIAGLALHFLRCHASTLGFDNTSIDTEALHLLQEQPWPGNVRELENVIFRAILLARGCIITAETIYSCLNSVATGQSPDKSPFASYVADLLREAGDGKLKNIRRNLNAAVERELYSQAIRLAHGNQARAAKWLGVSRPTMHDKLARYGLLTPEKTSSSRSRS
jgi:DNA-binding NtrC family response regulator